MSNIADKIEDEYKDYVDKVKEATASFEEALAGAKEAEDGVHRVGVALLELKRVVSYEHPGAITREPSPSLDPDHPQGLGRKLQPGEKLQQGVV